MARKDSLADERYEAGKEFNQLVSEIRKYPGFHDFLFPPTETDMRTIARSGPVAVINVSELGSDALLIEHDRISVLPLPHLSKNDVDTEAKQGGLGRPEILEWLWDTAARPILDALGLINPLDDYESDNNWPRVWWITTGPLSQFPIRAAGYHGH